MSLCYGVKAFCGWFLGRHDVTRAQFTLLWHVSSIKSRFNVKRMVKHSDENSTQVEMKQMKQGEKKLTCGKIL